MHISINTAEDITELDQQILALLAGGAATGVTVAAPEPAKPAAKATAAAKPKPTPEPEPLAEEPVEEDEPEDEEEEVEEEESDEPDEDISDKDLLALAVKKATEMVANGKATDVKAALDSVGAARVRELNADNVREFFKALS